MQLYLLVGSIYVKAVFSVSFVGTKHSNMKTKNTAQPKLFIGMAGTKRAGVSARPHTGACFPIDQQPDDDKFLIMK